MSTCRRMKVDPYLSSCTKLKFKWIKDNNINLSTLNLIEEKVGGSLQDMCTGEHFLHRTQVAQFVRATMNKWVLLKLRASVKQRTLSLSQKGNLLIGRRSSKNPTLDKGLISKIYKDFKKLDSKTLINLIKQWGTEMYREFSKYSITTLILSLAQPVIAWPPQSLRSKRLDHSFSLSYEAQTDLTAALTTS